MGIIEILIISISLAMDAFAVAVCKGLAMKKMNWKKALVISAYFCIFQSLMPLIGYKIGNTFENLIINIDHWIAFILLALIGLNMIKESFDETSNPNDDKVNFKTMIILALATSIDALTVGITFSFLKVNLIYAVLSIGVTAFILSLIGVKLGNRFGNIYKNKAELCGGIILIIMGLKILLDHLEIF